MYKFVLILFFGFYTTTIIAFPSDNSDPIFLPRIFQIGEHQEEYEALIKTYNQDLLEVCNNDLSLAYGKLSSMFREMEVYAENLNYDLKGVRMWIHLFWNEDGSIQYLAFHLRPNSRNIALPELETFLLNFIQDYRFPLLSDTSYSLYTSTSFPRYARRKKGN